MLIVKLNTAGKGYKYHGLESFQVAPRDIDAVLPHPSYDFESVRAPSESSCTDLRKPCVAYAVSKLSPHTAIYAVGGFWPQVPDEFGRLGVFAWAVLIDQATSQKSTLAYADGLTRLVSLFEQRYEALGRLIEKVASDCSGEPHLLRVIANCASTRKRPETLTSEQAFEVQLTDLPLRMNLQVPYPLSHLFAIPCLAWLVAARDVNARAAGGCLSTKECKTCSLLSVDERLESHPTVVLDRDRIFGKNVRLAHTGSHLQEMVLNFIRSRSRRRFRWREGLKRPGRTRHFPNWSRWVQYFELAGLSLILAAVTIPALEPSLPRSNYLQQDSVRPPEGDSMQEMPPILPTNEDTLSSRLFYSDVIIPVVHTVFELRPDGLGSTDEVWRSLLWQLKSQHGEAVFLRNDSSFAVTLSVTNKAVHIEWKRGASTVGALLAEAGHPYTPEELRTINGKLNIYGRATLSSQRFLLRRANGGLILISV